jgi:hypothetical protein
MAFYNYRLFGNPLTLPYQVNRTQYAAAPFFIWQRPTAPPQYRHEVMKNFYLGWELDTFEAMNGVRGLPRRLAFLLGVYCQFYLGWLFTLPLLLGLPWILESGRMSVPRILLLFSVGCVGLVAYTMPHYFAAATAPLYCF